MSQHLDTLKICERNNGGVLSRFAFATATTIQQLKTTLNNENTVKKTTLNNENTVKKKTTLNNENTVKKNNPKQRKHCEKHCFFIKGLEKVVFREGNCRGNQK